MTRRPPCDVCGLHDARPLTAEERSTWFWLAGWIGVICSECRRRFHKSAERYLKGAA